MKPSDMTSEILKLDGWTQARIADEVGVSQPTVARWIRGQDPEGESRDKLRALHTRVIGRQITYSDEDPAAPGPDAQQPADEGVSTLRPYRGEIPGSSPDIDVSAGAGPGGLPLPASLAQGGVIYSADAIRGEILLPPYLLSEFTRAKAPRVHWVAVRGDSMIPTLLPGERVMVDTTDTAFGQGGIFVLRDPDGEVLVKRLRKLKGGQIEIVSDNERQGNEIHPAEDVAIIGRVVGRLGRI